MNLEVLKSRLCECYAILLDEMNNDNRISCVDFSWLLVSAPPSLIILEELSKGSAAGLRS